VSFLTKRLGNGIWGTIDGGDVENPLLVDFNQYTQAIENSGSNPIYIGEATPGTAKSAAGWRIKKLTYSSDVITDVQWANGSAAFDFVWNDRASYTYS
jgi:hypothetical protein